MKSGSGELVARFLFGREVGVSYESCVFDEELPPSLGEAYGDLGGVLFPSSEAAPSAISHKDFLSDYKGPNCKYEIIEDRNIK